MENKPFKFDDHVLIDGKMVKGYIEQIEELELACKQKDTTIHILQDIICDNNKKIKLLEDIIFENREKVLDELTKQAQELNMGY